MKYIISLLAFLTIGEMLHAQNIAVQPVEFTIKRPDINRQYEETELVISVRDLGREFIKVKSFNFSLKDDLGNDLLEKNKENLKVYEKNGFYTSRTSNWEYFNYAFYNRKDAFGSKLSLYSAPSDQAKRVELKGEVLVWVKAKNDKPGEAYLNNIVVKPGELYSIGKGTVKFTHTGYLTLDKREYMSYKVSADIPVSSIDVVGQKRFEGIPTSPDEVFLLVGQSEHSFVFKLPDAQLITIPVELQFAVGF
jgi:hypothetical protein